MESDFLIDLKHNMKKAMTDLGFESEQYGDHQLNDVDGSSVDVIQLMTQMNECFKLICQNGPSINALIKNREQQAQLNRIQYH